MAERTGQPKDLRNESAHSHPNEYIINEWMHICSFFFSGAVLFFCCCCAWIFFQPAVISLLFDRMMDERGQPGWRESGGGAVEQQKKYTRGQRRKSHDDFQLNGGNVTEINLHKYNMVRACCCHFICPLYRRMYVCVCAHMCACMYVERARTNMFAQKCVLIYVLKLSFRLRFFFLFFKFKTELKLCQISVCHASSFLLPSVELFAGTFLMPANIFGISWPNLEHYHVCK